MGSRLGGRTPSDRRYRRDSAATRTVAVQVASRGEDGEGTDAQEDPREDLVGTRQHPAAARRYAEVGVPAHEIVVTGGVAVPERVDSPLARHGHRPVRCVEGALEDSPVVRWERVELHGGSVARDGRRRDGLESDGVVGLGEEGRTGPEEDETDDEESCVGDLRAGDHG